jgi:2-polyprenyl-6-methoxyphenol hydroxylase-like FAD-dependent oxidoreductase
MAGLMSALALAADRHQVRLFERDGPPPAGAPDDVFQSWRRRGASQLRHTHAFRARLTNLLRDEHPAFFASLGPYGLRRQPLADVWPTSSAGPYAWRDADEDLTPLMGRRTTLETALRRHLAAQPNVAFHDDRVVTGLVSETDAMGRLVIGGLRTAAGAAHGDLVIDAAGRLSPVWDWLKALGAAVPETDALSAGIVYFTQFYRLERDADIAAPVVGDLGYLQFGVIPAEAGHFSITLAIPESDDALRLAAARPERFAALIDRIPAAAQWTRKSQAVGRPVGMGDLKSRWRSLCVDARPLALNLFPVGDSLVLTNPLYGRGCTLAALQAHLLRDVLRREASPTGRARLYTRQVQRTLRSVFEDMRARDRALRARLAPAGHDDRSDGWRRLAADYLQYGQAVAARCDPPTVRAALRAFHLVDPPHAWKRRPRTLAKSLAAWIGAARGQAVAPPAAPGRDELLAATAALVPPAAS